MESLQHIISTALDAKGGQEIATLPLEPGAVAEYFIIATGTSSRHLITLAEDLCKTLKAHGITATSEGQERGDWIVVDAGSVIAHLFKPEIRALYNLEELHRFILTKKPVT